QAAMGATMTEPSRGTWRSIGKVISWNFMMESRGWLPLMEACRHGILRDPRGRVNGKAAERERGGGWASGGSTRGGGWGACGVGGGARAGRGGRWGER